MPLNARCSAGHKLITCREEHKIGNHIIIYNKIIGEIMHGGERRLLRHIRNAYG